MSTLVYITAWRWLGDKPWPNPMMAHMIDAGIILCMHPANERRRYIVMSSLIGWAHAQMIPACIYASVSLNLRCSHQLPWYLTRCRRPFKMMQADHRKCIWNHTDGLVQYCSNSSSISNRVSAVLQYSHQYITEQNAQSDCHSHD